jgi:hypothetical protein
MELVMVHKSTLKAEEKKLKRLRERQEREALQARNEEIRQKMEARTNPYLMCTLGEDAPEHDADNINSALVVALKFARAYKLSQPVVPGVTSLLDLERRTYYEAVRTGLRFLCDDGTLSEFRYTEKLERPFSEMWTPVVGANLPITQEQLDAALQEIKGNKENGNNGQN